MRQPASTVTSVFAGMATSRTSACGLAPFSAAATIESKESSDGAVLVEELADAPGELDLGAARELLLGERGEDPVRDRGRRAHALELGRLLDRPQPLDDPGARDRLDAAVAQRLVARDGEDVRLDPDASGRRAASARSPITARAVCSKRTPSSALAFCA